MSKSLFARVVNYRPGKDAVELTVRLGPNTTKEKLERFLGEEGALLQMFHAPPEVQLRKPNTKKPKGGNLSIRAAQWCKDKKFQQWLLDAGHIFVPNPNPASAESDAKKAIYRICSIKSRSELDHSKEVENTFKQQIIRPYAEWLKGIN